MRVQVRLFAALAEAAGARALELDLADGATAVSVRDEIAHRFPRVGGLCERSGFAVNAEYVSADRVLSDGDEVALIPPVSGG